MRGHHPILPSRGRDAPDSTLERDAAWNRAQDAAAPRRGVPATAPDPFPHLAHQRGTRGFLRCLADPTLCTRCVEGTIKNGRCWYCGHTPEPR